MDFSMDFPIDPENLPEEMPEEVKQMIRTQHAAQQHHQMVSEQTAHDVVTFIDGLDEHDLMLLRGLVNALAMGDSTTHGYYFGVMSVKLEKFGICLACGKKHEDEFKKLTEEAIDGIAENVASIPDSVHKQTGTPGCTICGRDNDHGTHFALEQGGHMSHRYWPSEVVMQYPLDIQMNADDQQWANFMRVIDPEDLRLLEEYQLSLVPQKFPKVVCKNCEKDYPNIQDRMLKPKGKAGCEGCNEKEKWG